MYTMMFTITGFLAQGSNQLTCFDLKDLFAASFMLLLITHFKADKQTQLYFRVKVEFMGSCELCCECQKNIHVKILCFMQTHCSYPCGSYSS